MNKHLNQILTHLEVERLDELRFSGLSPSRPARVFGGQVLAQALNAAAQTVSEERTAHSLHAYFLRPGNPTIPIIYEVDPIRDGRGFTTRRVVALQNNKAIFNASLSFQLYEEGLSHQFSMPQVTPPEQLEEDQDFRRRLMGGSQHAEDTDNATPIERYPVNPRNPEDLSPTEPQQDIWFRVPYDIGDDPVRHQTLLTYISDFALLGAALRPHPYTIPNDNMQFASIDHALWFHRPARVDDYLLYSQDGPSAEAGRGFSRGSIYSRSGTLVASTAQESLLRVTE